MDYENIIFVQHSVYTGSKSVFYPDSDPKYTYDLFYDPIDLSYSGPPYPGYLDESRDINERVAYLKKIINKAKQNISKCANPPDPADKWPAGWDKKTLVVFVTPEFYFRPKQGSYSLESVERLKEELRNLVNKGNYESWLFVFGTIIGESDAPPSPPFPPFPTIENEVYILGVPQNQRVIGFDKGYKKKYTSGIDYVKEKGNYKGLKSPKLTTLVNVKNESEQAEPGIFSFGGIKFGIEICLDHLVGALRRHLTNPTLQERPHIHIITSSGMNIRRNRVVALPKGHVFHCDGGAYHCDNHLKGHKQVKLNYKTKKAAKIRTIASIDNSPLTEDNPNGTTFFAHTGYDAPVLNIFKAENVHNIPPENWA